MNRSRTLLVAAVVVLATIASFIASSSPDGLNRVASDLGFSAHEVTAYHAPLPGYAVPGLPESLSGVAASLLGTAIVGALAWSFGRALKRPAQA